MKTLAQALLIAVLGAGVGLGWNQVHSRGIPLTVETRSGSSARGPDYVEHYYDATKAFPPSKRISVDEAYRLFKAGPVHLIDSRSEAEFDAMHIPGALNINHATFAADIARHYTWLIQDPTPDIKAEFPDGIPIVVYCNNPYCDQGALALRGLWEFQPERGHPFRRAKLMTEGLDGWKKKGYPVVVPVLGPDGRPGRDERGSIRYEERSGASIPRLSDTGVAWLPSGVLFAILVALPWIVLALLVRFGRKATGGVANGLDGVSFLLRLGLGAVFLFAAYFKLADPSGFSRMVLCYEMVPLPLVPYFTVGLPGIEALAGALLVLGLGTRPVSLILLGLLTIFVLAVYCLMVRNMNCVCGCFPGKHPVSWTRIYEDAVFLFAALLVFWRGGRRLALERLWGRKPA